VIILNILWSIFIYFPVSVCCVSGNPGFEISTKAGDQTKVARWFVFKPKIKIWVNFGGSCYGKSWYIL
jgi:hypothetical protein